MNTRTQSLSLLDAALPQATAVQNVLLVVAGSVLMALCAQISFPLPGSPVPVTLQTFGVLLIGATFGRNRAAAALFLYLAQGAAGLPVFAPGGAPGVLRFAGPTAGYLISYPLAAFAVAWMMERLPRRLPYWFAAVTVGMGIIYTCGLAWLMALTGASLPVVLGLGLIPFLPGAVLKVALVTALLPASWWAVDRGRRPQQG